MNEDVATKKIIHSSEVEKPAIKNTVETSRSKLERKNKQSEDMVRFQKQQADNQQVKLAMARELAQMGLGLPDHVVSKILNIDDKASS